MADTLHPTVPDARQAEILGQLAGLLEAAGRDPDLHGRLRTAPRAVLAEAGLPIAEGVEVTTEVTFPAGFAAVLARTTPSCLVLPLPPLSDGELSDADLEAVAGSGAAGRFMAHLMAMGAGVLFAVGLFTGHSVKGAAAKTINDISAVYNS
ncbi:hypothetical protein [Tistrella mobilis]|uniref:Uncharacterized protein n=1 Tax=Tistrella mobilis (strain KA081020-065) TaxID=1110502 RepID=I3TSW4_TISMK|nr:hypothetical protein [Tistrella mobilis]AFK55852.1 hypothetical protein TMO_a0449 [Tistrella mobilis KA081020-065]